MTKLQFHFQDLKKASSPIDFFGDGTPEDDIESVYKSLIRVVHPDMYPDEDERLMAEEATKLLNAVYALAQEQIADGTYKEGGIKFTAKTRKESYVVKRLYAKGDLSSVYRCSWSDGVGLCKVGLNATVNTKLEHEFAVLKEVVHKMGHRIPVPVDTFLVNGTRANVYKAHEGIGSFEDLYTLEEVKKQYPDGIPARAFVWVWNRMLDICITLHSEGYVHGALLPNHILINPESHLMMIVGWPHSVKIGEKITFVPKEYKWWYPNEVLDKVGAYPETDLYLAAKSMQYVIGDSVPDVLTGQLRACQMKGIAYREGNAHDLYNRFQDTIEKVFGTKKFVEFVMKGH